MAAIVYNPQESWTVRTGIDVTGSQLNDTIVNGAYPEDSLVGAYGSDQYEGHNVRIWGNEGKDAILNHGYDVTISGGAGNDSIRNFGSNVRISGDEGSDKFIISGASENNTISDFTDGVDELLFESGAVKAELNTYYSKPRLIIKSAETNDTLVVLEGVTSGNSNKIIWRQDDGGTTTTSIDSLIANGNSDSQNPDDTLPHDSNVIYGTTGNNNISNSRNNVRIEALAGNDTIKNDGTNVTISGGAGNDSIGNYKSNVSINGGTGSNKIFNSTSSSNVTIEGGSDVDSIDNNSSSVSINSGDGNDIIENGNYFDSGNNVTIVGGNGDDSIRSFGDLSTIDGGNGDDTVINYGNHVLINSGDGNDIIDNQDSDVTIAGGKGNDHIKISEGDFGKNILLQYQYGDGDDTVEGFNETSTLSISGGSYSSLTSNNDVIIKVGNGFITLKDAKDTSLNIIGTYTPDTTPPDDTPDDGGNTDDEPYWTLDDLKVFLDAFNQFKSLGKLSDVFDISVRIIDIFELVVDIAQNNKKYLDSTGKLIEIIGDTINIIGDVRSLKGKNNLFWSLSASGLRCLGKFINTFDIDNLSSNEESKKELKEKSKELTEEIADLANESVETTIKALGKLSSISQAEANALAKQARLKANAAISVLMAGYVGFAQYQESLEQYSAEELPLSMVAGETFIDAIAAGLHGGAHQYTYGLDDLAFKGLRWVFSFGQAPPTDKNYMEWITEGIKVITFGSTSAGDTLEIDHDGEPPLYAQGGDDYILNVFSNVKIYGGDGNDTIFSHEGARRNYLNGNNGRDCIIALDTKTTVIGASENDKLMSTGDGNSISGGDGIDFILLENASENIVNGGTETDIISIENSKNTVIYYAEGDGNDIIFGYDEDDTIHVAGKTKYTVTENEQDVHIKIGDSTIILKDAAGKNVKIENRDTADNPIDDINPFDPNPVILQEIRTRVVRASANAAENSTPTYVTNEGKITDSSQEAALKLEVVNNTLVQTALNSSPQIYSLGSATDSMDWIVNASSGEDSITSASNKNSTINSGAGNDTINVAGSGNVYVNSSTGNDVVQIGRDAKGITTVETGKGNDTINNAGNSKGLFKYSTGDGNDLITGFNSISTLSIAGARYSSTTSNDDLILSIGSGKITLVGANNLLTVNISGTPATTPIDTIPTDTTPADTAPTKFNTLIVTDSTESNVTLNASVKVIDASSRTANIKITGNSLANSIVGGRGNDSITGKAGNDTLDSRSGNDSLSGGTGNDLFIYSAGNDIINDYTSGDTISLSTAISSSSVNGSHVILNTKNGSLTIQNAKGKTLSLIDSSGKNYSTIISGDSTDTTSTDNQHNNSNTQHNSSSTTTISSSPSTSTGRSNPSTQITTSNSSSSTIMTNSNSTVRQSNTSAVSHIYTGGDQVISNYSSEQKIALGTLPTNYIFGGGNFALTSDTGTLFIPNAYDKVIDFVDGTGIPFAKAYSATNPGVIDGRGIAGFEIIAGSDWGADFILVGDDGSSLWGGNGFDADTLVGGNGIDIFIGGKYQGNDIFVNASSTDFIFLNDTNLSDVIASVGDDRSVAIAFNTGNVIVTGSSEVLSATFLLADGSAHRYNHVTKAWQNA